MKLPKTTKALIGVKVCGNSLEAVARDGAWDTEQLFVAEGYLTYDRCDAIHYDNVEAIDLNEKKRQIVKERYRIFTRGDMQEVDWVLCRD